MEAIFAPSSTKNHRNTRDFIHRPTENLAPMNYLIHGGNGGFLFAPPPPLSFSYPPPSPAMYPNQQPPLLPLPISNRRHNSLPARSRNLTSPPITRKSNRPRDPKKPIKIKQIQSKPVGSGPDPKDLPKVVSKVLSSIPPSSFSSMVGNVGNITSVENLERFSGSMFTPSPHPSSLPLPKFSVKPKLSCTAQAAAVDAGATDNLRRILRLR
ncbi:hypothetical protein M5689_016344 [Euphorbia peplus]|nr:hypothetical protein M5689_016344 [Euphorbia peplus]